MGRAAAQIIQGMKLGRVPETLDEYSGHWIWENPK